MLQALDAETAHGLTMGALARLPVRRPPADDPRLGVTVLSRRFPNPVGLAAGFDKGARAPDALLGLGFGFVEVGGVVPQAQPGNPRPRVFRLPEDGAVINRFGLNSEGLAVVRARLEARRGRRASSGQYRGEQGGDRPHRRLRRRHAGPRGARRLHHRQRLLAQHAGPARPPGRGVPRRPPRRVVAARNEADAGTAVLLKIAPDISLDGLDAMTATARRRGVDALVVSNTTVARPASLAGAAKGETGGLSGRPLFSPSTRLLAETSLRVGTALPLIGVGGIDSAEAAWTKIRAGASLVQLYSALVYAGPGLVEEIKAGLVRRIEAEGLRSLADVVGRDAAELARSA